MREERRLRVFGNRVLRKIFGSKKDEVTGVRRLRNEKLYDMYSSPDIRVIKSRMRWADIWGVWKIGEAHAEFW